MGTACDTRGREAMQNPGAAALLGDRRLGRVGHRCPAVQTALMKAFIAPDGLTPGAMASANVMHGNGAMKSLGAAALHAALRLVLPIWCPVGVQLCDALQLGLPIWCHCKVVAAIGWPQ